MNERIRELAKQAKQYTHDTVAHLERVHNRDFTFDEIDEVYDTKFALLIVEECANVIADDDLAKDCGTIMMDSYAKGMRYSAHLIKEHFGVE
jgi:hypothetical protein